ncbi:MAG TPA: phosphoglycerate mutase family protein [Acidimicrobiales bacterium]|nr:phosphoglycerate mutase family protein [Acidimicrobiales bacterium]
MSVLLIRHAHAGARKDWGGDDHLRPLSGKGKRQAEALVELAEPFAPQRLLSSPYTRCLQTMEPLAAHLSLRVEPVKELAEGSGLAALALVRALADEKVALCTHGDVIPEILVALADEDRLDLGHRPRQAKGSAWVLDAHAGRFVRATYLPAA